MLKGLCKNLAVVMAALFLISGIVSSCSKDDNGGTPEPVDPETPYVGSWRVDIDEYEIIFLVFDRGSKVTCYNTDQWLLDENKYEDKIIGSYTYDPDERLLTCKAEGSKFYCQVVGTGGDAYLLYEGEKAIRVNSSQVPRTPADGSQPDDDDDDDDNGDDDGDEQPVTPSGPVSVTTMDCRHTEQLRATLHCKVSGASDNAEIGFYLGFDPDFGRETFRKVILPTGGQGDFYIETKGIYGEQKYYYRAYVIDGGKEYLGATKSFESLPIRYTINGKTFKPVLIKDGPNGDFCMLQTEIPCDETFKFGDYIFGPIDCDGSTDGEVTAWEIRHIFYDLASRTGLPWRCPTTDEWQMAYRGGYDSKGYKYSGSDNIDDVAWYTVNSRAKRHDVATKLPNELGIYDLCGNLSELVNDNQGKGFNNHSYMTYEAINGILLTNKSYGGNFNSAAKDCTANSSIKSEIRRDVIDGGKIGFRFVYSVDPAFIPYEKNN